MINNLIPTCTIWRQLSLQDAVTNWSGCVFWQQAEKEWEAGVEVTWISRAWYMIISPRRMIVERLIRHFRANEYRDSWKRAQH